MQITAAMVKELRQRTGAGMMECKRALTETDGDMEKSIEQMRISGLAKADKKSDRTAAEGVVVIKIADDGKSVAMVEINSETDFVAKADDFTVFVNNLVATVLASKPADLDALLAVEVDGVSVEEQRKALIAKIGENIQVRRFVLQTTESGTFGTYLHGQRIGVICELSGGDVALSKDIAMHIAASKPVCVSEANVPADILTKEKDILIAEAKESGKPDAIVEKMVEGRMRKYLAEITLLGQSFIKDPDQTIAKLLGASNATAVFFQRYEVGEGIERKVDNFAEEVMAQVKGS